ncbi:MAG: F0F1 ATP synthase subunit A [Rhodospirillaceae bacterium]
MEKASLNAPIVFHLGPVPVGLEVVTTWAIMAVLVTVAYYGTRRLSVDEPGPAQVVLESVVGFIESTIRDVMGTEPGPFVPLIGTLFIFIAACNLSPLLPGVKPPTASFETTSALGLIVFFSVHTLGIRRRGLVHYVKTFLEPYAVFLPLNVLAEFTRTFSLMVRLAGNIMSHELTIGIVISLVGLLVPIPFMALSILIGLVQAYIFTILATVFIGGAIGTIEKG